LSYRTFICHPDRFFLVLRHDPPFGLAILLLLLLSLLFGVSLEICRRFVRGYRNGHEPTQILANLFGPTATFFCSTAILACVDYCFLRLFRSGAPYEWLFCVVVYAWLPFWLVCIPDRMWQLHWLAYRVMKVLSVGTSLWITALCWAAVRADPSLAWWQDLLLDLPLVAPIWAICIYTLRESPDMISACLRWRRSKGKSITLFYQADLSTSRVAETVRSFESALDRVTVALGVSPLTFRIPVYLFPDRASLHKCVGPPHSAEGAVGYSHNDAMSLVFNRSDTLAASAAHELTHVLRFQRVARKLVGLLDEGLACYVEHLLYGAQYGTRTNEVALPTSWRTMTRYTLFYEWLYTKHPENESDKSYSYAYSMAAYLIDNFGMEKYLDLCRKSATDKQQEAGEKFAQAVQDVYARSASNLEAAWRSEHGDEQAASALASRQIELARKVGELESQVRQIKHQLEDQQVLPFESDRQRRPHVHGTLDIDGAETGQ
jgi:hypothetical protein